MLKNTFAVGFICAFLSFVAFAQQAQGPPSGKFGAFEFKRIGATGENYQVYKGNNAPVAMVVNGQAMQFSPSVKAEDVQAAYDAYKKSANAAPAQAATTANGTTPAAGSSAATAAAAPAANPTANAFDAKTQTANLPAGGSVTFVDAEHVTVRDDKGLEYALRYHGKSAGGFLRGYANTSRGNMGASLLGSGVEISYGGRKAWDTGDGVNLSAQLEHIRPIAQEVFDAADLAKAAGQPVSSKVLDSLQHCSLNLHEQK